MQVAIDAQHQLLVTKFSDTTRGFKQKLLQCHAEVQVNVVKFHNHSLAIEVYRYLSDAMEHGLRRHLSNLTLDFASELRKMQVLDEKYAQHLRRDLMSEEGVVQKWSEDLDMYWKKCFAGLTSFCVSWQQRQFQSCYNRRCILLREELAEMQHLVVEALPIACWERHCSPPHPRRVEPPLEAGRGDEHEENEWSL